MKKKWRKEQRKEKTRRAYIKEKGVVTEDVVRKKKGPLNEKCTLNMLGYGQPTEKHYCPSHYVRLGFMQDILDPPF